MKISCQVDFDPFNHVERIAYNVPDVVAYDMGPITATDEPELAMLTGEVMNTSRAYERKIKVRKDAVDLLAKEMAKVIMKGIESRDTLNGYPIVRETAQ